MAYICVSVFSVVFLCPNFNGEVLSLLKLYVKSKAICSTRIFVECFGIEATVLNCFLVNSNERRFS